MLHSSWLQFAKAFPVWGKANLILAIYCVWGISLDTAMRASYKDEIPSTVGMHDSTFSAFPSGLFFLHWEIVIFCIEKITFQYTIRGTHMTLFRHFWSTHSCTPQTGTLHVSVMFNRYVYCNRTVIFNSLALYKVHNYKFIVFDHANGTSLLFSFVVNLTIIIIIFSLRVLQNMCTTVLLKKLIYHYHCCG